MRNVKQGGTHEEVSTFARYISKELADEEELKDRLPIDFDSTALFDAMSDGLIGLHLLNKCQLDINRKPIEIIDMRTVHKGLIHNDEVLENLNQFYAGCAGLIRKEVGFDDTSFLDKSLSPMLDITW